MQGMRLTEEQLVVWANRLVKFLSENNIVDYHILTSAEKGCLILELTAQRTNEKKSGQKHADECQMLLGFTNTDDGKQHFALESEKKLFAKITSLLVKSSEFYVDFPDSALGYKKGGSIRVYPVP